MIHNRLGSMFVGDENPFAYEQLSQLINNAYTLRTSLMSTALHSRKDINKECDYPETAAITINDYKEMYDRNPIATRVVGIMPEECWQASPEIYEDEDVDNETEFEKSWKVLGGKLVAGEESWFEGGQEGNPIWEYLYRADRLSGIGHFGIVVMGIDDGKPLDQPIDGFNDPENGDTRPGPVFVANQRKSRKLLYLSVFDESSLQSIEYESNVYSARYRKPKRYSVQLGDFSSSVTSIGQGRPERAVLVHWSRVIHIADNMDSSDVIGVPRQRPVWNNLLDLMKIYGGDAEGFWKNCVMRIFLETHPQLGGDVSIDESSLRDRMWDMENGLQKWAALMGMSAKTIAPTVVDPISHINAQIEAIAIKIGVPKRIFTGSERGQLASGQDDSTWNDRVRGRRSGYITSRIIVPFIDRLIQMGVLPEPEQYYIVWPDPEILKPLEKATLAVTRTDAMAKYIGGQVDSLIDPLDYMTRVLEFEDEEAKEILERAMERAEEAQAEQEEQQARQTEEAKQLEEAKAGKKPEEESASSEEEELTTRNEGGVGNVFCSTGEGGGVDPTCSLGGEGGIGVEGFRGFVGGLNLKKRTSVRVEMKNGSVFVGRVIGKSADGSSFIVKGKEEGKEGDGRLLSLKADRDGDDISNMRTVGGKEASKPASKPEVKKRELNPVPKISNNEIPTPSKEHRDYVTSQQNESLEKYAKSVGKSPAEVEREWDAKIKEVVDRADTYIRVPPSLVDNVLEDGRYKSQFETKSSYGGDVQIDERRSAESLILGTPKGTKPEDRPIYGYASQEPVTNSGTHHDNNHLSTKGYGQAVIQLKESVKDRSTITFGDSLNQSDGALPSPMRDPSYRSANFVTYKGETPFAPPVVVSRSVDGQAKEAPKGFGSDSRFGDYTEVQIHHGVSLDDVEKIWFPEVPSSPKTLALLKARGVKWEVIK